MFILTSLFYAVNVRFFPGALSTGLLLNVVRLGRLKFVTFRWRVPWNLNQPKASLAVSVSYTFLLVDVFLVARYLTEVRWDGAVIPKARAALKASTGSTLAVGLARPDEKPILELGYAALPKPVLFTELVVQNRYPQIEF